MSRTIKQQASRSKVKMYKKEKGTKTTIRLMFLKEIDDFEDTPKVGKAL